MAYGLLEAAVFLQDLDHLDPSLHDTVVDKLRFLEHNPKHPSLKSEKVRSLTDIWRSHVNDYYRLYWFYHPKSRGEIVLWRVGPRTWTERLKQFSLPDLGQLKPFHKREPQVRTKEHKGFFAQVHPNHLILLGVPEERVEDVRDLDEIDGIFDLGLPSRAEQILVDLYTSGWWGLEQLVRSESIFYRANADEIESYCKGKTTKLLLDLHPAQRRLAYLKTRGPLLVKGVAGSGKTTIGLYRALHLADQQTLFSDSPQILFVTYNETLAKAVKQLFCELRGQQIQQKIDVKTLRDWSMDFLDIDWSLIAKKSQHTKCLTKGIQDARDEFPEVKSMHSRGNGFFSAEIADVIKGRGVSSFREYRELDRFGRKKGLSRTHERQFVWRVYETYQEQLVCLGLYDYEDVTLLALKELGDSGDALYDAVIVDEAQDLRPTEIQLVARLAGGRQSPRLTLLADPQQSIYYSGVSWSEAGVNIVGRTKPLSKNFRNTRQILDAAWSLAQHGVDDKSDIVSPDTVSRQGSMPQIVERGDFKSQLQAIREIILKLCQPQRYNPGDFAVLAYTRDDVRALRSSLAAANIPVVHYRDETFDIREYQVKAVTMHSAKGLEWPVVIVAGLEDDKLPRKLSPSLDDEERASEIAQERKLLYVAMTRAMERLYLITSPPPSMFLNEIDKALVLWSNENPLMEE